MTFVINLLEWSYRDYEPKHYPIERIIRDDKPYYRTTVEYKRPTPFLQSMSEHGIPTNHITLYIEPFDKNPDDLDMFLFVEELIQIAIVVSYRDDVWENQTTRMLGHAYSHDKKLVIPLDLRNLMEVHRVASAGSHEKFDEMLRTNAHKVIHDCLSTLDL